MKLFSRTITAPASGEIVGEGQDSNGYGITSDPLIQFACVYSALIHGVCHPGVPNMQLVEENAELARVYKGKCITEQNAVDVAWNLLLQEHFSELRATICATEAEMSRFRQLVFGDGCDG